MGKNITEIIKLAGGAEALAALTGVSSEAVRKWRQNNAVPARHWYKITQATGADIADLMPGPSLSSFNEEADSFSSPTESGKPMTENTLPAEATAVLLLADGTCLPGKGFGAHTPKQGTIPAEICFHTGMTGYQETITDPSFDRQIITFTFPHIGNVGTNKEDNEARRSFAAGVIVKNLPTEPSNWRSEQSLSQWMADRNISGIAEIDTRNVTRQTSVAGATAGVILYPADGVFDWAAAKENLKAFQGFEKLDMAAGVSTAQSYQRPGPENLSREEMPHVVAFDFGGKESIWQQLRAVGCRLTVIPAATPAAEVKALQPDGIFLSNGPGDPAATGVYVVPVLQELIKSNLPVFGICLGHQLLGLAAGAGTYRLHQGHRGANQPVKNLQTGKVEITSQNHGFALDPDTLPDTVRVTHVSLFDGSNEGIEFKDYPVFSVQYHPEAGPGPHDTRYLFGKFRNLMKKA